MSIVFASTLIHCALQTLSHILHPPQFVPSISGRTSAKRETHPSAVPTGQTVLHHTRPFHAANATSKASEEIEKTITPSAGKTTSTA
jgi:hypothetical protein